MYHKNSWRNFLSLIAVLGLVFGMLPWTSVAEAVASTADLSIELKASTFVEPGGEYVVHIAYTNLSTTASPQDTWVKATLPSGTQFVSAINRDGYPMPPNATNGNELTWNVGAIAPGACCERILVTILAPSNLPDGTLLTTVGKTGSSASDPDTSNNTFSIATIVSDLACSAKQAHVTRAKPADEVTYTITILLKSRPEQSAAESQREVTLTDILPPSNQMRFMGWIGENSGTYDGTQLQWKGNVQAGAAVTLQYRLGIEGDVPAGTILRNRARLTWNGGAMDLEPVDVEVYKTEDDYVFGPQGGQWQHQSGITLDVPPNAVHEFTRFQLRSLFGEDSPYPPAGWKYAHHGFELNAYQFGELHQFGERLTITIRYQGEDVAGMDPNTLRLWYRSSPGEPWAMLGEPQMHQNGQISFTTDHLTEFALFGQPPYRINLPFIRH